MLMFEGNAEAAMNRYVDLLGGEILEVERHGADQPAVEGKIRLARFRIRGQDVLTIDSPAHHDFTFTPATSLFVTCDDEQDLRRLSDALLDGGQALMPLDDYGFSTLFTWVNDSFGVSWQLNLP